MDGKSPQESSAQEQFDDDGLEPESQSYAERMM